MEGVNSMTLGKKSIYTIINVTDTENPKNPYEVVVQANKNYGICSIAARKRITQKEVDKKTKKKKTVVKFLPVCCNENILTTFQGRQYNNPEVLELLENTLYVSLNPTSGNE